MFMIFTRNLMDFSASEFDGTFNYVVATMLSTNFNMKAVITSLADKKRHGQQATIQCVLIPMRLLHSESDGPFHSVATMLAINTNMKVIIATLAGKRRHGHVLNLFVIKPHVFMLGKKCGASIFALA